MNDPPTAVARLAKALFALDNLVDARMTLLRNEPLADPDTVWRSVNTLVTQCQMIADLLDPMLYEESELWEAIHWIRDQGPRTPNPPAIGEFFREN